jgi:hypothetical protein
VGELGRFSAWTTRSCVFCEAMVFLVFVDSPFEDPPPPSVRSLSGARGAGARGVTGGGPRVVAGSLRAVAGSPRVVAGGHS